MRLTTRLAAAAAALVLLALPAAANAQQAPPKQSGPIGLEVTSVDADARTVTGLQHCVEPALAGQPATFQVGAQVDISLLQPGARVGIRLDGSTTVVGVAPAMPCQVGADGPAPTGPGSGPGSGPGEPDALPSFGRGFLNRVWKFAGEADDFDKGVLSMTISKILNLPKRYGDEKDELVDEDAIVLVAGSVRVYGTNGKRTTQGELSDAEGVRVQGKLLATSKWRDDADGQPTPTIRAKKIYITK
jgi:hypothetical protein